MNGEPVCHLEFTLENWSFIRKYLRISHWSELGEPKEIFKKLEKRYISFPEINRNKLSKDMYKIFKNWKQA